MKSKVHWTDVEPTVERAWSKVKDRLPKIPADGYQRREARSMSAQRAFLCFAKLLWMGSPLRGEANRKSPRSGKYLHPAALFHHFRAWSQPCRCDHGLDAMWRGYVRGVRSKSVLFAWRKQFQGHLKSRSPRAGRRRAPWRDSYWFRDLVKVLDSELRRR